MTIEELIDRIRALGGVLVLQPGPGDGSPEISWGDVFFYYAPDGRVPTVQPFATIVTKDYPDDDRSRLNRPEAFRLNVVVGAARFREVTGLDRRETAPAVSDPSKADVLFPHPVYGKLGWMAVVNPAEQTSGLVLELLTAAHEAARLRWERRGR